ncbi:MAG TPA: Gfo/Idh/MocA family oxidoreductase [Chitinophagaceae bacterium]|nr:Gfo/Idh/MocA family oxidoreductase [Chitinophagaceae bacterium]
MNWGIIGPGNIAHDFTRDLGLIRSPQRVTAILGRGQDSIDKFTSEFEIEQMFTDLGDFIAHGKMDAVYIATPHPEHCGEALACLRNRIPVLCEKPMTINEAQCQQLIRTSRDNNIFLMEGMWIRFLPSIHHVMKFIREGRIGNIVSLKAQMSYKAPHEPHSRYFDPALGGGSLLDLGIYPVFLAMLLLGRPAEVKAVAKLSPEEIDEACSVLFHYDDGAYAILESSLISDINGPAEIQGDRGIIRILNPWFGKSGGIEVEIFGEGKIVYPCTWEGHGLQFEAEEMIACLDANKIESDAMPHDFSLDMIRVLDEIRDQVHVTYAKFE